MFRRVRDWLRTPGFGPESALRRGIQREVVPFAPSDPSARDETHPAVTASQAGVLIAVDSTLAHEDRRSAARLRTACERLVAAASANLLAREEFRNAAAGSPWSRHSAIERPPVARAEDPGSAEPDPRPARGWTLRRRRVQPADHDPVVWRDFDRHQPLISGRKLAVMELVFVVVEVFFWYRVFTEDVDRSAADAWLGLIGAGLLAVLLPLAGVAAARILGQLGNRLVGRYPGVGAREWLGTAVAGVVISLIGWATYELVYLRFADPPLGVTPLPAQPMAFVFVVVLAADVVARTFLRSELHDQRVARNAVLDRWTRRVVEANEAHERAWSRLREQAQAQLARYERIVAVGAALIAGGLAPRLPDEPTRVAVKDPRDAHRPAPVGSPGEAVPLKAPNPDQLRMFGVALALGPVRLVADAINALEHWPPMDQPGISGELAELRQRWYGMVGQFGDEAGPRDGDAGRPRPIGVTTRPAGVQLPDPLDRMAVDEPGPAGGHDIPAPRVNGHEPAADRPAAGSGRGLDGWRSASRSPAGEPTRARGTARQPPATPGDPVAPAIGTGAALALVAAGRQTDHTGWMDADWSPAGRLRPAGRWRRRLRVDERLRGGS
jgi:hypothetical protein